MKIGDDTDPFVILGNIPELSAVFETKARAPFKMVCEVCRLSELIEESRAEEKGAAITETQVNPEEEAKGEEEEGAAAAQAQEQLPKPTTQAIEEETKGSEQDTNLMVGTDTMQTEDDHMEGDNPFGIDEEDEDDEVLEGALNPKSPA